MVNRSPELTWLKKVYTVEVCNVNTSNTSTTIQNKIIKQICALKLYCHTLHSNANVKALYKNKVST